VTGKTPLSYALQKELMETVQNPVILWEASAECPVSSNYFEKRRKPVI
jgi:hypothetical protein